MQLLWASNYWNFQKVALGYRTNTTALTPSATPESNQLACPWPLEKKAGLTHLCTPWGLGLYKTWQHHSFLSHRDQAWEPREREAVSDSGPLPAISLTLSLHPFPPMETALLTIATQPRAWILSLTADKWLNNLLPRFFSRKVITSWICSEMGANKSESLF